MKKIFLGLILVLSGQNLNLFSISVKNWHKVDSIDKLEQKLKNANSIVFFYNSNNLSDHDKDKRSRFFCLSRNYSDFNFIDFDLNKLDETNLNKLISDLKIQQVTVFIVFKGNSKIAMGQDLIDLINKYFIDNTDNIESECDIRKNPNLSVKDKNYQTVAPSFI